jgi:Holliday junction resolvasome RuvABC ATP-dependent DNA helicase subunit
MRFFKQLFKRQDIFKGISGHDEIKWMLDKAINNEDPIHILLVGPPALGKTRLEGH